MSVCSPSSSPQGAQHLRCCPIHTCPRWTTGALSLPLTWWAGIPLPGLSLGEPVTPFPFRPQTSLGTQNKSLKGSVSQVPPALEVCAARRAARASVPSPRVWLGCSSCALSLPSASRAVPAGPGLGGTQPPCWGAPGFLCTLAMTVQLSWPWDARCLLIISSSPPRLPLGLRVPYSGGSLSGGRGERASGRATASCRCTP